MKHPILCGAALTAALLASGVAASAMLDKAARAEYDPAEFAHCEHCGRAILGPCYEVGYDGGRYICSDPCLEAEVYDGQLPHWWLDAD